MMLMIDKVRRALVAAGFARIDAHSFEDGRACVRVTIERWGHFARHGEKPRMPIVVWQRRIPETNYEELDVFGSLVASGKENDLEPVLQTIAGEGRTQRAANE